jgi:monofunctional biosynthetic peptidoglycan transglycosylase
VSRRTRRCGRRWLLAALLVLPALLVVSVLPVLLLRVVAPPTTVYMQVAGGGQHEWVALESISPWLVLAVIAAEDQRFVQHRGFDLIELREAVYARLRGERLRGASTITQQTAKNLFLWPGRSWLRKLIEAWYALWLELLLPKSRIMELYLNIAQFGPAVFGAEAAARAHFGLSAAELDAEQAAWLAAVLPTPSLSRIDRPSASLTRRQAWIRRQMAALGLQHAAPLLHQPDAAAHAGPPRQPA